MPVTLAQAKINAADDVQAGIIDEFRKNSILLDSIVFDDVVNPAGGGATLTYGYNRLATQASAAFRAVNAEYTPGEVTKQRINVDLKPFGGSYQIDRVLAGLGPVTASEVALQSEQKIKAAKALFSDAFINGDTGVDANAFDGLSKALTGTTTELGTGAVTDLTTVTDQNKANDALDIVDGLLSVLDGEPTMILGNTKSITKIRSLARRAGYHSLSETAFGTKVERYGNSLLVDLGAKPGTNDPIIPIYNKTVGGTAYTGLTDVYVVRLGLDGIHGITMAGQPLVKSWLPDFSTAGAVKTGEVEIVAAVAIKATKAGAVQRNVKVQ